MQAAASIALLLMSVWTQPGMAQQPRIRPTQTPPQTNPTAPAPPQAVQNDTTGQPGLPQAPAPKLTEPLYLRDTGIDYTKPKSHLWNPIAPYTATNVPAPRLTNTDRLKSLLQDGKIYLSLSDAVALALENNYDIAIARINLDIADTDILRAKAGSIPARRFDWSGAEYAGRIDTDDFDAAADRERPRPEPAARARAWADW